ncbi:MAG: WecB/TagA/CpsF family glycosyltransferase [Planctomycetota bacterium]
MAGTTQALGARYPRTGGDISEPNAADLGLARSAEPVRGKYWRSASLTREQLHRTRFTAIPRVWLRGFDFHAVSESRVISMMLNELEQGRGGTVVTPNLHILRLCCRNQEVADLVKSADIRTADGMPLIWASRMQRTPLPERVAGSSLIYTLPEAAAKRGKSIFFLGGNPGTAEACAAKLKELNPDLEVAGTLCPPYGFDSDPMELSKIYSAVQEAEPDIVFVALGCPKQERLMRSLYRRMPETWFLGVGYSFSFVAGEAVRAPEWVQRLGFEWFHRLTQEPMRLFRRYFVEGIPFFGHMVARSAVKRFLPLSWRRYDERLSLERGDHGEGPMLALEATA